MYEVKNLINGKFRGSYSGEKVIIKDITDSEKLVVVPASTGLDLAMAFKGAVKAESEMKNYSTDKIIDILKEVSKEYLKDKKTRELICKLSGSVMKYIDESLESMKYFMLNADKYLEAVFGNKEYFENSKPIIVGGEEIARRIYKPKGIVGTILPGNDMNLPVFVLSQIILSKNPGVVKPDSREPISTYEFVKLLHKFGLENIIQLVNWSGKNRPNLVKDLIKYSKQRIIFGSDETVEKIACHRDGNGNLIADYRDEYMYQYGMGRSKSIIAEDADLEMAAKLCVEGAAKDRGTKCISNKLVFVDKKIYDSFMDLLEKEASKLVVGDPLNPKTDIGYLGEGIVSISKKIIKNACDIHEHKIRCGNFYKKHTDLIIIENVTENSYLAKEEIPIPLLSIIKVNNFQEAVNKANAVVEHTPNKKSLVVAVFTNNKTYMEYSKNIKTWKVIRNKATTTMNPFLPHQGRYIIEDLMKKCVIES